MEPSAAVLYECALWRFLAQQLVLPCFDWLVEFRGETAYQRILIRDVEPQLDELMGVQGVGWSNHVCMEAEQVFIFESNEVVIIGLLEVYTLTSHALHSERHRHVAHRTRLCYSCENWESSGVKRGQACQDSPKL